MHCKDFLASHTRTRKSYYIFPLLRKTYLFHHIELLWGILKPQSSLAWQELLNRQHSIFFKKALTVQSIGYLFGRESCYQAVGVEVRKRYVQLLNWAWAKLFRNCGQRPHLLLRQSKFESCRQLKIIFCTKKQTEAGLALLSQKTLFRKWHCHNYHIDHFNLSSLQGFNPQNELPTEKQQTFEQKCLTF